jgi:hypothetical protein
MKIYELVLHCKQGDDLSHHLMCSNNPTEALRNWGREFGTRQQICERIAIVISDQHVKISADTHFIAFHPENKKAEAALDLLVQEKILFIAEVE